MKSLAIMEFALIISAILSPLILINVVVYIVKKEMLKTWEEMPPVFTTSSVSGFGNEPILNYIDQILEIC